MVTIDEIAKELGIAKSTVSNALSGKRYVSQGLKDKIIAKCEEYNFTPNFLATSLSTGKTKIIGLFLQVDEEPKYMSFYNVLIEACLKRTREKGFNLLLYYGLNETQAVTFLDLGKAPIDGAIILSPKVADYRVDSLKDNSLPCVVIGKTESESNLFSYVDNDNGELIRLVTKKLFSLGHRNIALINSDLSLTISKEREEVFAETCKNENSWMYTIVNSFKQNEDDGFQICEQLLTNDSSITAIITANDLLAKGVYDYCNLNNIVVGKDVAVVCLGGEKYTGNVLKPLLSYGFQDYSEIGKDAVDLVVEKIINETSKSKKILLKSKIFYTDSICEAKK